MRVNYTVEYHEDGSIVASFDVDEAGYHQVFDAMGRITFLIPVRILFRVERPNNDEHFRMLFTMSGEHAHRFLCYIKSGSDENPLKKFDATHVVRFTV